MSAHQYQCFPSVRSEAQMTDGYCAPERAWDRFDFRLELDQFSGERGWNREILRNFKKQYG